MSPRAVRSGKSRIEGWMYKYLAGLLAFFFLHCSSSFHIPSGESNTSIHACSIEVIPAALCIAALGRDLESSTAYVPFASWVDGRPGPPSQSRSLSPSPRCEEELHDAGIRCGSSRHCPGVPCCAHPREERPVDHVGRLRRRIHHSGPRLRVQTHPVLYTQPCDRQCRHEGMLPSLVCSVYRMPGALPPLQ